MNISAVKELTLYKYRYWFGYELVIVCAVISLGWQLGAVMPGLNQPELETVANHSTVKEMLNMPTYPLQAFLQKLSMKFFGLELWALRLPSVILAAATALVLYMLFKRWFGKPSALLSIALFLSADWMLFIGRSATGSIELSFWLALSLLAILRIVEKRSWWLIILAISLGALLFVPYGPYLAISIVASLFTIKHLRRRVLGTHIAFKIASSVILLIAFGLATYVSFSNSMFAKAAFGLTQLPSFPNYFKQMFLNVFGIVGLLPWADSSISPSGVFFIRFFELIMMNFGVIMLWRTRVNKFNIIVFVVTIVLILASGLDQSARGFGATLVPSIIFMAAGLRHLTHRWKKIFPNNPYARMASFVPLMLLMIAAFSFHFVSYFVLWPTQSASRNVHVPDLSLAVRELNRDDKAQADCALITQNQAIATIINNSPKKCVTNVSMASLGEPIELTSKRSMVDAKLNYRQLIKSGSSVRALTSDTKGDSVRWVVIEQAE